MQSTKTVATDTPLVSRVPLSPSTCAIGMQEPDDEKYWQEDDDVWDEATLAEIDSRLNQTTSTTAHGAPSSTARQSDAPAQKKQELILGSSRSANSSSRIKTAEASLSSSGTKRPFPQDAEKVADSEKRQRVETSNDYIIASDDGIEALFKKHKIAWGVQFEVARLISSGKITYIDVTEKRILELAGTNEEVCPTVQSKFFPEEQVPAWQTEPQFAEERNARLPWKELDREEANLAVDPLAGVGLSEQFPDWYGGKVEFSAKVSEIHDDSSSRKARKTTKPPTYKITLCSPELASSSRFARRCGSWSFLTMKIPQASVFYSGGDRLIAFFKKRFIIWGRVFRAIYAKNNNVCFYWTDETVSNKSTLPDRLSFERLINWHNPLTEEANRKQTMGKWAARMALGFSNSIPILRLEKSTIGAANDIMSSPTPGHPDAPPSDMTDGCGLSAKVIHKAITEKLGRSVVVTAFQFRLGGCKGLSLLDHRLDSAELIAIRPSQRKIVYSEHSSDPALFTIDLLRTSYIRTPGRISGEFIINLAENGVPADFFKNLMRDIVDDFVGRMTAWDGPHAMEKLWYFIERDDGVLASRRARENNGEARARGYSSRSFDDLDVTDETDGSDPESLFSEPAKSQAWCRDRVSGSPSMISETILDLISMGFKPQSCAVLREKIQQHMKARINWMTREMKFELKESLSAFVVPDPLGVLGANQIYVKSSTRNLMMPDGVLRDVVEGEVLVGRNPCKVPTDIRKLLAVDRPELSHLVDVIVCSVKGNRRLLDFLAGGDYDGDTALVMWNPEMVASFTNADESYADPPADLEAGFTRSIETGTNFLRNLEELNFEQRTQRYQHYLLGGLQDPSLIGQYSTMHDNAIYMHGYGSPEAKGMGYTFNYIMDSAKTGRQLKASKLKADQKKYQPGGYPQWRLDSKAMNKGSEPNGILAFNESNAVLKRHVEMRFILDTLYVYAKDLRDERLGAIEKMFSGSKESGDPDLLSPWQEAFAWAHPSPDTSSSVNAETLKGRRRDLARIAEHVHHMFTEHSKRMKVNKYGAKGGGEHAFTSLEIEHRQDVLRGLSLEFSKKPLMEEMEHIFDSRSLARIRASYAYTYDLEKHRYRDGGNWSRFPWNVAFRELGLIKLQRSGDFVPVNGVTYDHMKVHNKF